MGIPGIFKEIGKGERIALTKLAIEHFERTNRPLRIAIDAAIWNFQNAASQGGKNPALRTFFFRLLKILALPIFPVFIYDGPNKPLTKRGKTVARYGTCIENEMAKQLLSQFKFPFHTAPGEAEAECASLQKNGIVDAVMSQDVDAIMFGSSLTLRDWSKEGTYGNKTPTHVSVLDSGKIKDRSGLDSDAMILVALLSGGDYDDGVAGFGSSLACEAGKAGFGSDLLKSVRDQDKHGLKEWKERLEYELQTNESGYFRRRHLKLRLPNSFPDMKVLQCYMEPRVSETESLAALEASWMKQWETEIDSLVLRKYTATMFDWNWRKGARRFVRCFAQPMFQDRLRRGLVSHTTYNCQSITADRKHFVTDGIVEMRMSAIPALVVGLDINAEEDDPDFLASQTDEEGVGNADVEMEEGAIAGDSEGNVVLQSPSKKPTAPWNPYATEKWWIPATLLKVGLGPIVEEWEQKQRDVMADPKKFATRNCAKLSKKTTRTDNQMKPGAIRSFLTQPEAIGDINGDCPRTAVMIQDPPTEKASLIRPIPKTPTKRRQKTASERSPPSITRFFKPRRGLNPLTALSQATVHSSVSDDCKTPQLQSLRDRRPGGKDIAAVRDNAAPDWTSREPMATGGNSSKPLSQHLDVDGDFPTEIVSIHDNITERARDKTHRFQENPSLRSMREEPGKTASIETYFRPPSDTKLMNTSTTAHQSFQDQRTRAKVHAIARESLPGTWKDLSLEEQPRSRLKRISYVDLTGD